MQLILTRFIGISKASSTSTVCRKEGSSDKTNDDDEKQLSEKDCSESSVDSELSAGRFM